MIRFDNCAITKTIIYCGKTSNVLLFVFRVNENKKYFIFTLLHREFIVEKFGE